MMRMMRDDEDAEPPQDKLSPSAQALRRKGLILSEYSAERCASAHGVL